MAPITGGGSQGLNIRCILSPSIFIPLFIICFGGPVHSAFKKVSPHQLLPNIIKCVCFSYL